jgi:hypothetical protein
MRTTLSIVAILCAAIFFGCKKNEYPAGNNNPDSTNVDPNAMKYLVSGITDLSMDWKDSTSLPLSLVYTSGNQENLALSFDGIPQNLAATFSVQSGLPPFNSILTLKTNNVAGGVYNIKIVGTTATKAVKKFDMKLTVNGEPPMGCVAKVAGAYSTIIANGPSSSSQYPNVGDTHIDSTGVKNKIQITNLMYSSPGGSQLDVTGTLNCDNKTIVLDEQQRGSYKVTGGGTYTNNEVNIGVNFTIGSTTVYSFSYKLTRK